MTHTVEVTAATLYEAVAQELAAIRLGRRGGAGIECGESVGGGRADRARSEADGIYKNGWNEMAHRQRPEQDSRNPGNVDATVEPTGR
jgi:hypothetical protein